MTAPDHFADTFNKTLAGRERPHMTAPLRLTLSYRDVEVTLAQRRLDSSYKMVQRWALEFGPTFARNLRRLSQTSDTGRLDEMVLFEPKSDALTALTRGIEVSFDLGRT